MTQASPTSTPALIRGRTINPLRPPRGWALLRSLDELPCLRDPAIRAATLLPRDPTASLLMCEQIEQMTLPVTHPLGDRALTQTVSYYHSQPRQPLSRQANLEVLFPDDPRLQSAYLEVLAIGATLADIFVRTPDYYVSGEFTVWHDFKNSSQLHTDNKPRKPIPLVHNICLRPTIVALDDGYWQSPPATHSFFKADHVRHCADRTRPERPHVQLGHDVVRVAENLLY